jgi:hypothetical protein
VRLKLVIPLFVFLLFFEAKTALADVVPPEKTLVRPNIIVSATIGIPKMTLWGYGPPQSVTELSGVGVNQRVTSDSSGYFSFDLVFLPDTTFAPELCVTAVDQAKRVTPPTCIPPIGGGNYFYSVGPVILPPTISLAAPQVNPGSQVSAQGETIPGSTIEIKLARPDTKQGILSFNLVKSVFAYYVPAYTVESDSQGKYSFNMPTGTSNTWRVFAVTDYEEGAKSPKSNTLKLEILTAAVYFWKKILEFLMTFLKWPRIIILELLVIIILALVAWAILNRRRKRYQKGSQPIVEL